MWWLPIAFPLVIFALRYFSMQHPTYEMDPPNSPGMFSGIYCHYYRVFLFISVIGLLCAVGLAGFVPIISSQLPADCLMAAAIYAFLFNGLLIYFYESYLAVRYVTGGSSNYTKLRYAIIQALAISSVVLFIFGLVSGFSEI